MIDWSRVEELRDEIGAEDFGEVVELFLDEVDGAVDLLALATGDAPRVAEQMHFLKGAALNLGFAALSDLCMTGEKAANEGNGNAVPSDEVRHCYDQSKVVFLEGYKQRFAA